MITKKVVYTCDYVTEKDITAAENLRTDLYDTYDSVTVFPQGSWSVIIEASNNNNK